MGTKQKPEVEVEVAQREINGEQVANPAQTETKTPAAPAVKDIRNGILRPKNLGIVGKLWAFFESASIKNECPVQRGEVLVWATKNEFKHSTATAQHARWRKYYGLTNSKTPEEKAARAEEKEAAKAKAAEERKAKAEAKAAEKAAKEQAKAEAKAEAEAAEKVAKEQAKKENAAVAQATSESAKAAIDAAGPDVSIEAEKVD